MNDLYQYMSADDGCMTAFGSPCTPFQVASVVGALKSAGSMTHVCTLLGMLTWSVGATCQPQPDHPGHPQLGWFCDEGLRLPLIQIFSGWAPSAIMRRHISCARPQQPSSGKRNGIHGAGALAGQHSRALQRSKSCCARSWETAGGI